MNNRTRVVFFLLLLLLNVDCRRSGGGGGFSRGGGAARGGGGQSPGGFNQGGGGTFSSGGGFRPQQPVGSGFGSAGGFRPQPSGFRSGTGVGSPKSSFGWKSALAAGALGAVGGIVAYEAGKAIIQSASSPFHYGGRPYYWDNNYQTRSGEIVCSMPLNDLIAQGAPATAAPSPVSNESTTPSPDQVLQTIQFKDGTRPKTVSWGCRAGQEVCCGTECCAAPRSSSNSSSPVATIVLGIIFGLLLLVCCCCIGSYVFCRSAFDKLKFGGGGGNHYNEGDKYGDEYNQAGAYPAQQQPQGYPMQPYPQQGQYPQQGGYPQAQPGYGQPQQGYPPAPYPQQTYPPNPGYAQQPSY